MTEFSAFKAGYWAARRASMGQRQYDINVIFPERGLKEMFKLYEKEELFND